jgi:flagellar motor switch protein FliN/FliY
MAAKAVTKKTAGKKVSARKTPVKKASGEGAPTAAPSGDHLDDTPMRLSVEVGQSSITLDEALQIGEQSLVELGKQVGDSVDVLLNGRLFARGEVVTVGTRFGVRITEIIEEV